MFPPPPSSTLFPYTTLFRSGRRVHARLGRGGVDLLRRGRLAAPRNAGGPAADGHDRAPPVRPSLIPHPGRGVRSTRRPRDRKSTRLNSSHTVISYAVFCLKK